MTPAPSWLSPPTPDETTATPFDVELLIRHHDLPADVRSLTPQAVGRIEALYAAERRTANAASYAHRHTARRLRVGLRDHRCSTIDDLPEEFDQVRTACPGQRRRAVRAWTQVHAFELYRDRVAQELGALVGAAT